MLFSISGNPQSPDKLPTVRDSLIINLIITLNLNKHLHPGPEHGPHEREKTQQQKSSGTDKVNPQELSH